ncbi:MAG: xanthine dehydrogenase family protein molybdopterin-binding subunit [Chloroflexi bacterium]|nr:xanthine dehydrogenase family protein molybdopterin-binding subunit [Chloroflexota bacterium]
MTATSLIGQSIVKPDARDKALGRTQYGVDLKPRDALVAKVLRSPHPHARILRMDVSKARQLPGVVAVVTAEDTPAVHYGRWVHDRTVFARDKVRHVGEPVAAVAAVDEDTAEEALDLISVEYEQIPEVVDPQSAMAPGAPLVHEDMASYGPSTVRRGGQGNILDQTVISAGDVEKALAQCDVVQRQSYQAPATHHGTIQTHEAVASVDATGKVTLWSATKSAFAVRQTVCLALGLPMSRLRLIVTAMGGDFGARGTAVIEPIVVLLALKTHRPVALTLTRQEEFTGTSYREPAYMELEVGAKKDGTLLAVRGKYTIDTGAYHDSVGHLRPNTAMLVGPYRVPNFHLEGFVVYTNNVPRGHVRAPRAPYPIFAIESLIDAVADKLGMDPVEMRLKNAVQNGDTVPIGAVVEHVGFTQTLQAVSAHLEKEGKPQAPNQAWGVAAGQWSIHPIESGGPTSAAYVKVNEDGTAVLVTGVADQGAGQHALMAQIVAEVLSIPYDAVSLVAADTDLTPYEQATGGSRTTYRAGTTVRLAAEDARRQLISLASERLKVAGADLGMEGGKVFSREAPEVSVTLAALGAASLGSRGGPIMGSSNAGRAELMEAMAKAHGTVDGPIYCCHAAQVEVDPETGQVKVLKYFVAQDVGRALNPKLVEAQIQGGVVFGLGGALTEAVAEQQGHVLNANLLDYRQPVATSVPPIEMTLIEEPSQFGPWGAKGVGEPPTVPVGAAIANAIFRAVGARVTTLPLTPDRVVQALKNRP